MKVPYALVIGDKEVADGSITVNSYKKGDLGTKALDDFIAELTDEISSRRV